MNPTGLLKRNETAFLIIDIQQRLMPVIHEKDLVFSNANKLIRGAGILNVPLVVTEQYPRGLGNTCAELLLPEGQEVIEKVCFSCVQSGAVNARLRELKVKSLVLAGVEAHICVLKTALEALEGGFQVHVVADAVSSRTAENKALALSRLKQSGVFIVSTEMILFQLLDTAGTDDFKQISNLIK